CPRVPPHALTHRHDRAPREYRPHRAGPRATPGTAPITVDVAVLQAGSWGTTLATILARDGGRSVVLWTRDAARANEIAARRENERYLPGVSIPNSVVVTDDLERAMQADALVVATPAQGVRALRDRVAPLLTPAHRLCSATKGLTPDDSRRMSELWTDAMPASRVAVLSGP